MCYQIILGRNPESAIVIDEARTQPVKNLLLAFLSSEEFVHLVAQPLAGGTRLPHEVLSRGPRAEQVSWFADIINPDEGTLAELRSAKTWRIFIHEILNIMEQRIPGESQVPTQTLTMAEKKVDLTQIEESIAALEAGLSDVQRQIAELRAYFAALLPEFPDNTLQPQKNQPNRPNR
jgi:hypothetical protein